MKHAKIIDACQDIYVAGVAIEQEVETTSVIAAIVADINHLLDQIVAEVEAEWKQE